MRVVHEELDQPTSSQSPTPESQMVQQSLNVAYSDGSSQVLWEDGERVFSRGWRLDDNGNRLAVLLVVPAADHPSRSDSIASRTNTN